jgi:hypothetical protein
MLASVNQIVDGVNGCRGWLGFGTVVSLVWLPVPPQLLLLRSAVVAVFGAPGRALGSPSVVVRDAPLDAAVEYLQAGSTHG